MARGEVTGRKPKTDRDVPRLGFRIPEFCRAYGISEDFYYRLQRDGLGPKIMKLGGVTIVSVEAAEAWRREREAATAETETAVAGIRTRLRATRPRLGSG